MSRLTLALGASALLVAACGGGSPEPTPAPAPAPAPAPSPTPPPDALITPLGTAFGTQASKQIDGSGGSLSSADGALTVIVPAGAFAQPQTVSIQEISNEAPGRGGRAWRIKPEGLHSALPMTLRFAVDAQELASAPLDQQRVAYQSAKGYWRTHQQPLRDLQQGTISVSATHFSDWATYSAPLGLQLMPLRGKVTVGDQQALRIARCEQKTYADGDADGDLFVPLGYSCSDTLLEAAQISPTAWSVNGLPGGRDKFGKVASLAPGLSASFSAPFFVPVPRIAAVAVTVQENGKPVTLVSNLEIEAAACDWVKGVDDFEFDISVDQVHVTAEDAHGNSYDGLSAFRLSGHALRTVSPGTAPISLYSLPLFSDVGGRVSIQARATVADTPPYEETYTVDATPSNLGALPGGVLMLAIDHRDCSYSFTGGAIATGVISGRHADPLARLSAGALSMLKQPLSEEQARRQVIGASQQTVALTADDSSSGYAPFMGPQALRPAAGQATAHWRFKAAPSKVQ